MFGRKKKEVKEEAPEVPIVQEASRPKANRRASKIEFLPCPGLSNEDLLQAREEFAEHYAKHGQRPKEKIKYSFNDKEQIDYIREMTSKNVWYYKDRLMVARGPCNLHVLRDCWVHGVVDENTLVWGQGLCDWLPIRNVRTLVPQIRTVEVQMATFLKRQFGLKPALRKIRKQMPEERSGGRTSQVDRMY